MNAHALRNASVYASVIAFAVGLSGCAQLTTYSREVDLAGKSSLAIDVKQRVVISQKRAGRTGESIVTCAEPSPDALAVIGASAGASLGQILPQSNSTGSVSAALSESGSFVGLRTQSIQLLRDAMYRLCEAYAAGGIDSNEYEGMQRRFQSTMMGLIAIEQLTRPVIAGQALLATSAGAQAGAGSADTAVKNAETALNDQRTKVREAEGKRETKQKALDDAKTKVEKARAALQNSQPEDKAQAASDLEQARSEEKDASLELRAAIRERDQELTIQREAQQAVLEARSKTGATAGGTGALGELARSSAESTESLAKSVAQIVQEINASYMRDSCFNLYSRALYKPADDAFRLAQWHKEIYTAQIAAGHAAPDPKPFLEALEQLQKTASATPAAFTEVKSLCERIVSGQARQSELETQLKISQENVKAAETELAKSKLLARQPVTTNADPSAKGPKGAAAAPGSSTQSKNPTVMRTGKATL